MLTQPANAIAPDQAVTYKFKVREFEELFEELSPEQIHIALEGSLNIVFSQPAASLSLLAASDEDDSNDDEEVEEEQSLEEDQIDHEALVTASSTFALFAHQTGLDAEAAGITEMVPVDDPENTPLYAKMEETFRLITEKLASEISVDEYNQDVVTLYGEMQYFNHIELYTYFYDSKNEVLSVTISATNTEE